MRNIGDQVWYCDFGRHETLVTCPECLGAKHLTVIMGDGEQVQIPCRCCEEGLLPQGYVREYEWSPKVVQAAISGMEVNGKKVEYHIGTQCCYRRFDEDAVFDTEDEALAYGQIKAAEHEIDERQSLQSKMKDHRSWAWHAAYYRREIRDLEKRLATTRERLGVAQSKAKDC
jgi:hypothetical protein